jgi:hypothetical protein
VQQRLRARPADGAGGEVLFSSGPPTLAAQPVANAESPATARSGTLVQESGVDEADLLLSDGTHLYTLQPGTGSARACCASTGAPPARRRTSSA